MKMAEAMKAEISCMLKGIDRYAQSQIENLNYDQQIRQQNFRFILVFLFPQP